MKRRTTSELLHEIAEDYLHLSQDADGRVDTTRRRRYEWLLKLVEQLKKGKLRETSKRAPKSLARF